MARPFGRFRPRAPLLASAPAVSFGTDGDETGDALGSDGLLDVLGAETPDLDEDRPVLDPELLERFALPFAPSLTLQARPYQREAVRNWLRSDGRGVVVLPTGAGKTVVAFQALAEVPVRTLVIVPTIELLRQWRTGLIEKAGVPEDQVGVVGGGERSPNAITVMTYDSAAMPRRRLNEFGLLIVDEVHHLPAPTYRAIAEKAAAPWRLGLSATPERSDGGHYDLAALIGPEVYRRRPADLAEEGHIAQYREKRIYVDLTAEERARYDLLMAEWRWYGRGGRRHIRPGVGHRARRGQPVVHVDRRARGAGLRDQLAEPREVRLRAQPRARVLARPQHAEDLPEVLQRLVGRRPDRRRRARHAGRGQVRPHLQRARVQRHQRDAVGEHIVHLAGDAVALCRPYP
jgi:hypothetical protein